MVIVLCRGVGKPQQDSFSEEYIVASSKIADYLHRGTVVSTNGSSNRKGDEDI
jgi:hypothetical protein